MVNASLNWASILGIVQILVGLVICIQSGFRGTSLLKFICLLLSGLILFFQGWRLDPVLQFAVFMFVLPYFVEAASLASNGSGRGKRSSRNVIK